MSISIVTVVRNGAGTIGNCLASVEQQTLCPEHIVVDGQSTDGTLEILKKAQRRNPRLVVISEPDTGIYDAMRKGVARAHGEVIGCLNADDFYASTQVLEHVARVFEDPAIDSCYGDLVYVRVSSDTLNPTLSPTLNRDEAISTKCPTKCATEAGGFCLTGECVVRHWRAGQMSPRSFYWGWMPPHPTFFVRRTAYQQFGTFRLDLGTAADYELMLRFLVKHRITTRYIREVLVKMLTGGVSNASLRKRMLANWNDRKAWAVNGLKPYPWTLLLKPMRKLGQWGGGRWAVRR